MLQIVKDKTLKMELVQLQLDDNLSEENASDISPEVLVGPFKYLHAFFVRDQLIDFGVALQEL